MMIVTVELTVNAANFAEAEELVNAALDNRLADAADIPAYSVVSMESVPA